MDLDSEIYCDFKTVVTKNLGLDPIPDWIQILQSLGPDSVKWRYPDPDLVNLNPKKDEYVLIKNFKNLIGVEISGSVVEQVQKVG